MTRRPCTTRFAGRTTADGCDDCNHLLIVHTLGQVCSVCDAVDRFGDAIGHGLALLDSEVTAVRFELRAVGSDTADQSAVLTAVRVLLEALVDHVGTDEDTAASETLTGRVMRLEHPEEVTR